VPEGLGGATVPWAPLTVGIDSCYVREWEDKKKNFEVIVGKSMLGRGTGLPFRVCPDV